MEVNVNGHVVDIAEGWVRLFAFDDAEGEEAKRLLEGAGLEVVTILVDRPRRPIASIGRQTLEGLEEIKEAVEGLRGSE